LRWEEDMSEECYYEKYIGDDQDILDDARGKPQQRSYVDLEAVQKDIVEVLERAEKSLQTAYNLCFLEAVLHCDRYHEGKKSFREHHKQYGYLHAAVELNKGSIDAYFQYRKPSEFGFQCQDRIRKGRNAGYTPNRLLRRASHDLEGDLALAIEAEFHRVRKIGWKIKAAMTNIRDGKKLVIKRE
jgi:hypothetical protein